jgi:hypothetical protein
MKKWLWLLPIVAVLAFAGCSMPGNVYLSFDWSGTLWDWYSTDPNIDIPGVSDTLYPGHDYLTLPGDYYFDYVDNTASHLLWGIYYTLTAHKGAGSPGEDAIFMMYMPNPGNIGFWQAQGLAPSSGAARTAPLASAQSGIAFDKSNYLFKQLGQYTQNQGGYTLTARYGVWEPKK